MVCRGLRISRLRIQQAVPARSKRLVVPGSGTTDIEPLVSKFAVLHVSPPVRVGSELRANSEAPVHEPAETSKSWNVSLRVPV